MTTRGKAIIYGWLLLTLVSLIATFYNGWYVFAFLAIGGGGGYYLYARYKPKTVKYP